MPDADIPGDNPGAPENTGTGSPAAAEGTVEHTDAKATTKATAKKTARRTSKKAASASSAETGTPPEGDPAQAEPTADDSGSGAAGKSTKKAAAKKSTGKASKKSTAKKAAARTKKESAVESASSALSGAEPSATESSAQAEGTERTASPPVVLFQPPPPTQGAPSRAGAGGEDGETRAPARKKRGAKTPQEESKQEKPARAADAGERGEGPEAEEAEGEAGRRRRRRGGRRRRKGGADDASHEAGPDEAGGREDAPAADEKQAEAEGAEGGAGSRRRRRRRRAGEEGDAAPDDPEKTVTRVRKARTAEDEITGVTGSTRLEAKKQRRREGREAGRRRAPIVSEAEFLARREAVDRVMVVRQRKDLTQIAVLEDKVLVEHYVARESQTSLIGNVYLGRVQNVLPSMEAAFIDIGKGRNAVLYAGEVNWEALGAKDGQQRKIEQVLKSGQTVLVQVSKDPVGHKGARLTSQVSLPGRFLVYVPDGTTSGISRKLPDTERNRLKNLLKEIVPDTAGVIVRTAAEGASEEELTRDVKRLTALWDDIQAKVKAGSAPQLLYGEPDLTLKVVRDLFTEDFAKLVVSGADAWDMVDGYVQHVAPDLAERLERYDADEDVFSAYRIDEQIDKALDRKVWLPSGGSLIIDRTEAMTVIDVNTGKFTGSGGNLEETVTKNNLEAAEEIVRQLRLRDIGGIIVVDFIDMVLESNRDLVLRRLVECLGRDRTRHQVAEVTSLGLVQMTRKRIGTGLLEAFSESCEQCQGRGVIVHHEPVEPKKKQEEEPRRGRRSRARGKGADVPYTAAPSPKDIAAMAKSGGDKPPVEAEEGGASVEAPEAEPVQGAEAEPSPTDDAPALPERGGAASDAVEAAPPIEAEATPGDEAPDEPEPAPEDQASTKAVSTPEDQGPAEPAAPRITTTVRRPSAARPAGPPGPGSAGADGASGHAADLDVPAEGALAPDSGAQLADRSEDGDVAELAREVHASTAPAHVPVKKKGSRKR